MIASLNHPNICQLYDVGPDFLVMELIEGPTLQEHIQRGAVPLEEALAIARQITDALDAAHEKGIVHRDLKPANIKVKSDGTIKILDFGLAKVAESAPAGKTDLSHSPTITMGATVAGMILGTAGYMAPEQAKGRPVDKRADIWAFGAVLYEMLTGRRAFAGDDVSEIVAAVLRAGVDWSALPASTPADIRTLLRRCLEKDPKRRMRDIGDVRLEINEVTAVPAPTRTSRVLFSWAAVAGLFAIVAAAGWFRNTSALGVPAELTLTIVPPSGTSLPSVGGVNPPEISPDGSSVLYRAAGGLFVRRLDSLEVQKVPGSDSASNPPFWSADSTSVAFPTDQGLMKARLPDGAPELISSLPGFSAGGSWNEKGTILISVNSRMYSIQTSGREAKPVGNGPKTQRRWDYPEFLPGSDDFLFLEVGNDLDKGTVYLATLHAGNAVNLVPLLKSDTAARYTPAGGGGVLFVRDDNLYWQRLDLTARKPTGDPELVVKGVASAPGRRAARAEFSVSRAGAIAWRPGRAALSHVTTYARDGKVLGTSGPPSAINSMVLSPDESRLLVNGDRSWLLQPDQPSHVPLLEAWNWQLWSPDGSQLLGQLPGKIAERAVSDAGVVHELGHAFGNLHDVSPDGQVVLSMQNGGRAILSSRLDGSEEARIPKVVVRTGEVVAGPHFSPDGRWIVYWTASGESRNSGILVQPFPGPGLPTQIARGGVFPEWRKDGREIIYLAGDSVWSVRVEPAAGGLRFGTPQMLFSGLRLPASTNVAIRPLAI